MHFDTFLALCLNILETNLQRTCKETSKKHVIANVQLETQFFETTSAQHTASFKNLPRTAKNPPRTIQINDGAGTPSDMHPPQIAKRITARRAPNAGAVVSTPHGVFNLKSILKFVRDKTFVANGPTGGGSQHREPNWSRNKRFFTDAHHILHARSCIHFLWIPHARRPPRALKRSQN